MFEVLWLSMGDLSYEYISGTEELHLLKKILLKYMRPTERSCVTFIFALK